MKGGDLTLTCADNGTAGNVFKWFTVSGSGDTAVVSGQDRLTLSNHDKTLTLGTLEVGGECYVFCVYYNADINILEMGKLTSKKYTKTDSERQ